MSKKISFHHKIIVWIILLFTPISFFATHIVGGELTYIYNGGSNYTVKLMLYRDCGAGTAGFPSSVAISVRGNNGLVFAPSKDFTMNLASVATVSSNLSPCAVPPFPMPCVQAGTYTRTVTNLPPNVGGYHLYYQIVARNLTLTNINGACNCIGESFYAYIPDNTNPINSNSNTVFTLFPPLFLCVNQPFTFNHSATDANGDSLVYSLYTPYNGDNGVGPLDPTFPANIATFTPVNYLPTYTTLNPLGPSPFNINSSTGLISGTPGTIGQFVVGVRVKEYRGGVYISQTLRDFQFNVLACPAPPPTLAVPNYSINNGCSKKVTAGGILGSSATWTSIFPGVIGAYNSYLSCSSGCLSPTITSIGVPPPYVDFKVCGTSTNCASTFICDTFRVYFNPTLAVSIMPLNPVLCFGQTSTTLTAIPSGGSPPYSYLWNGVNVTQTISVGVGVYNIQLSDASGCPPVFNSVTVTSFTAPISTFAGANQTVCIQNPIAALQGTVNGATGGLWSGGTGTFSPNNTSLSGLFYTPSPSELAIGSATIFLTSTGNGSCPSSTSSLVIGYSNFTGTMSISATPVKCFGSTNGSAMVTPIGGVGPYSYSWSSLPTQTTSIANNLPIGIYTVNITNGIGCISQNTISITQPLPLSINSTVTNVTCNGANNGSITISPIGGTLPYTYLWAPGGITTYSISNLPNGTYTATVTDSKGCVLSNTYTISQPLPVSIILTNTNVSCFGGSNGSVNSSISGGTAPYTYSWSPIGATSPSVSGLLAGTYTLMVKDLNNCPKTSTINISQPPILSLTTLVVNETCDYLNNGSVSSIAAGGSPGYTYLWQPTSATTSSISSLSSGNYSLTITDLKGCTIFTVVTITQPPTLSVGFNSILNVSCFSGSNGSANAAGTGGTPIYTYTWNPTSINTASITNLTAGIYTVTVNDLNLCATTNTILIAQPIALSVTSTITNVMCNGGSTGSISITPNGGTLPYTYFWLPGGQSTFSVSNLPAGTYTAIVTDLNGCVITNTYTVTQPSPISIAFTSTNVSCFGGSNGSVNSLVSGGTAPYTYSWSPIGGTSSNASSLPAGTYTLIVMDNNTCAKMATITITQPPILSVTTVVTNETCDYLNNGSASASVSGGSPGYTYLWQPTSAVTSNISSLSSGNYSLTITDLKGCTTISVITITQPPALAVSFGSLINVSCFGGTNGSATASGSGGTPNYSYTWTPSGINTALATNLTAGIYTVSVNDLNSCLVTNTITISQPSALSLTTINTNVLCGSGSTGAIAITTLGGTGPYTHTLLPVFVSGLNFSGLPAGSYTIATQDANGCPLFTNVSLTQPINFSSITSYTNSSCLLQTGVASVSVASGGVAPFSYSWAPSGGISSVSSLLFAGSYTATVTDANGCTTTNIVNINDNSGPIVSILSTTNVSCFGGTNGAATASFVGGTGPFTYSWSPTGGSSLFATNLNSNFYTIKVVDNLGCIGLATTSLITQPAALGLNYSVTPVSCFGGSSGSAIASSFGGTPAYSYTWMPGSFVGSSIAGLAAGNYSVNVSDINNCSLTTTFVVVQPLSPLNLSVSSISVSCFGGANGIASSTVTGGTGPYNYVWQPGSISGQTISSLSSGIYTINVVDAKGCVVSNTVNIAQPSVITPTLTSINSNCSLSNGQITANASGGIGAYTYSWSPFGGTTNIASGLISGIYSVIIKDANNCSVVGTQTILNNPAPIATINVINNVSCFGGSNGSASVTVSGGTGPFTYSWMPTGGTSPISNSLSQGIYTVNITSFNGCIVSVVSPLITQPTQVLVSTYTTQVSCFGGANGSASVSVGGGTPAYTYTWLPSGSSSTSIAGLTSGIYTVAVQDSKNCIQTSTFSISQPSSSLSISSSSITNVGCFGGASGSASVTVSGGTPVYNYAWLPSVSGFSVVTGLSIGNYTLNVNDSKGCLTSTIISISQPTAALNATSSSTSTSCFGGANGIATFTTIGGTPAYSYTWSPFGGSAQTATSLSPGNYFVTITDLNGCQIIKSVTISQPPVITGSLVSIDPACGLANGSITSLISGGTGPYTYTWSPTISSSSSIISLLPGTYSLQVSDALGCIANYTSALTNIVGPSLNLVSTQTITCFGQNNGSATIGISLGTAPFTINWLPFGGSAITSSSLVAGTYTANVVDSKGCLASITANIIEPNILSLSTVSLTNVSCYNGLNGLASVAAVGGIPGYTYSWLPSGSGPTQSALGVGQYTVSVTDINNCKNSIPISISQPPLLTSTITNIQNSICYNSLGSATISTSGGTASYNYIWSTIPVQTGNVLSNVLAGNYSVTITDANGCTATNTVTITQPTQVITGLVLNDTICVGQNGTLIASATGGAGNYYYSWQPISVVNSGSLTVSPIINTTYTVSAFDIIGCSGTSSTVQIVVYNLSASNLTVTGSSPICPGESSQLMAITTGSTGPISFSWNHGLGTSPGIHVVAPTVPTTYIVNVTSVCGITITDSIHITFFPPPTVIMFPDTTKSCAPGIIKFQDNSFSSSSTDPITSWSWNFGDGSVSSLQNPTHTYPSSGTFTVNLTVTTDRGCTNTSTISPIITIFTKPTASFLANSTLLNIPYDVLILTNTSLNAVSYSWNFGDGNTSNITSPTYLYNTIGNYNVELIATSINGCKDTADILIKTIAEIVFPNAFTPNANGSSGGYYDISSLLNDIFFPYSAGVVEYKLQIFNRWGELIFETNDIKQGWDGYYRDKICPVGVYVWKAYAKLNNGKIFDKAGDVTLLR